MTAVDTDRRCPSDSLHQTFVCDGYGGSHGPIATPQVHHGKTLYVPGCYLGCEMPPDTGMAASKETAVYLARLALTCPVGVEQPCSHTAATTVEDVYGYNPWPSA